MTNVTQLNQSEMFRKRKSVSLTKEEWTGLKKFRKGFATDIQCALQIGVDRNVLKQVLLKGTGSPDSIEKVKLAIAA